MSFSSIHLYFDDLEVGQEWVSGGRTVTESDIVNFAGFSGDFNPIHIDAEFAKGTPFRRPIAHVLRSRTKSGNIQIAVGALWTAPDAQSRIRPSAPRKPSRRAALSISAATN